MSKKGFAYYVRLDRRTFQGRLIQLFLLVALIALAIFLFFRNSFYTYHSEKEYIHNTLLPTSNRVQVLTDILEISSNPATNPERKKINDLISGLNNLSTAWKEDGYLPYFHQILDAIESVQQLAEKDENWKKSDQYKLLQKNLARFQTALLSTKQAIEEEESAAIEKLDLYLTISFLLFFFSGITISHLAIKSILLKIVSFRKMMRDISKGYLPETIEQTPDEFASTRNEISSLSTKLKALTHFAKEVGQGNFDASIDVFEADSNLGQSLMEMRDSLKKVTEEEIARSWFNEGIARFSEISRKNNQEIDTLTTEIIGPLVKYLEAIQGAIFIVEEDKNTNTSFLRMRSCYAYDRLKYIDKKIHAGSGLIGQAFLEKEKIHLTEIPADYETITTGLGHGSPQSIIIIPLLENGRIEGILEIASMKKFKDHQILFLEKLAETIAATVSNVKNTERTQLLLEEAQMATEQLRAQEEEMRQNMEELQATQEDMERAQQEMSMKEFSLQAFVDNTPDAVVTISRDFRIILFNKAFQAQFQGTSGLEKIKEGTNISNLYGKAFKEWEAYYRRAFNGEKLHFSSLELDSEKGSCKEYYIFPVPSANGIIESISILIRDLDKIQLSMESLRSRTN